jgi:hypothetical protein
LYWIDSTAIPGVSYDYMVIADGSCWFQGSPAAALSALVTALTPGQAPLFSDVHVCVSFGVTLKAAPPLPPPPAPFVYALPGAITGGNDAPASSVPVLPAGGRNMAGLRWQLNATPDGDILPDGPIGYHLFRAQLGSNTPSTPAPPTGYNLLTADRLIIPIDPSVPADTTVERASDWPPFPLMGFDPGLPDGWYSYCLCGVDIFGRYSDFSPSGTWLQWSPPPSPAPWYYVAGAANDQVHPFAIRLLDKTPPPKVSGLEAYALDPEDKFLLRDAAYNTWWTAIESAWWNQPRTDRDNVLPIRVSWDWTAAQMMQAPDTKEFRIYFNPGTEPPSPDYRDSKNWQDRIYVVDYNDTSATPYVTVTTDADGLPVRHYDVLLPMPNGAPFPGVPMAPSEIEPIVYAHIGVSAADDQQYTADDPKWASGAWPNLSGNEGLVSPAKIYRVLRSKPPAPGALDDSEKVLATKATFLGISYFTFHWPKNGTFSAHIFRALDDTLFQVDWERRASDSTQLDPTDVSSFPISTWDPSTRSAVATELNALGSLVSSGSFDEAVRAAYRALSNNSLRTLAGLPGNEKAFAQITYISLEPDDPANVDRAGPDGSDTYAPDPSRCAYRAELDGRSQNRYFLRAAYVNAARLIGPLGRSSPPVYLPNVIPPRPPAVAKVLGGDRQVTITWVANRETDLAEYRIYRTDNTQAAQDWRRMTLVGTQPALADATLSPPKDFTWIDAPVPGLVTFYYRVVAVDKTNNSSVPSPKFVGRAFDDSRPGPPTWNPPTIPMTNDQIALSWSSSILDLRCLVQRRIVSTAAWENISNWLAKGLYGFTDYDRNPSVQYDYRLLVMDSEGKINNTYNELTI